MLQALIKNKARSFLLGESNKIPREDILTDCVFGGLRYLDADSAACVLRWMFEHLVPTGYVPDEIRLWPKREKKEPDAFLRLSADNMPPISLIVEAKWGSNKLWADQLAIQWQLFGELEDGLAHHILLVQHRKNIDVLAYKGASDIDRDRRTVATWEDLAGRLAHRDSSQGSREANALAADIAAVLLASGQRPFLGWAPLPHVDQMQLPIFFANGPWWDMQTPPIREPIKQFQFG